MFALLTPGLAPFDPYAVHVLYKYAAPGTMLSETGQHFWLGTDQLGRDTLSRLMYGARVSLLVSLAAVFVIPAPSTLPGSTLDFSAPFTFQLTVC